MRDARRWVIACAGTLATACTNTASACEMRIFSTIAVQSALEELAPRIEAAIGCKPEFTWATAAIVMRRVQAGETPDVVILTRPGLDTLDKAGKVSVRPAADIASSVIAVVVRHGAPRPDISTPEAFKRTLLQAKSVAFSDPAVGGASGVYMAKLLERMGIAEAMKAKVRHPPPSGNAATLAASGEAELAIQQEPELMSRKGVDWVGRLPAAINQVTTYSVGVGIASPRKVAAAALIDFLHTQESAAVFESKWLAPVPAPKVR